MSSKTLEKAFPPSPEFMPERSKAKRLTLIVRLSDTLFNLTFSRTSLSLICCRKERERSCAHVYGGFGFGFRIHFLKSHLPLFSFTSTFRYLYLVYANASHKEARIKLMAMEAELLKTSGFFTGCCEGKGGGPQEVNDDDKARALTMEVKKGQVLREEGSKSPSMIGLGLEISADKDSPVMKHGNVMFTAAQLHELQLQALIFKYIAAGLPVPPGLLFPVWRNIVSPFGSNIGGIHRQFPTFVGFSRQGYHNRHMMDPEPGRCRRTDGKKWRCSRNVIPGQKYCERHMHRGSQRSRKPVEASQIAATSDKIPPNNPSKNLESSNSNNSNLTLVNPQLTTLSLNNTRTGPSTDSGDGDVKVTGVALTTDTNPKNPATTVITSNIAALKKSKTIIPAETTNSTVTFIKNKSSNINTDVDGIDDGNNNFSVSVSYRNMVSRSNSNGNIENAGSNPSQGLDFSPKSVLQVQGCSTATFYKSDLELEPGRCRRTDGKKWRCRRGVVANQKYCGMHMHRGAKKHVRASLPADFPTATADVSSSSLLQPRVVVPNKTDCTNLNTNLSISIQMSPQLMTVDDTSTTGSSSDATISDTIVCAH